MAESTYAEAQFNCAARLAKSAAISIRVEQSRLGKDGMTLGFMAFYEKQSRPFAGLADLIVHLNTKLQLA